MERIRRFVGPLRLFLCCILRSIYFLTYSYCVVFLRYPSTVLLIALLFCWCFFVFSLLLLVSSSSSISFFSILSARFLPRIFLFANLCYFLRFLDFSLLSFLFHCFGCFRFFDIYWSIHIYTCCFYAWPSSPELCRRWADRGPCEGGPRFESRFNAFFSVKEDEPFLPHGKRIFYKTVFQR